MGMSYGRQKGFTLWTWAVILALVAFFGLMAIRVFPMYLNQFKVKSHLRELAADPATSTMMKTDIVNALTKRFEVDNVDHVNPRKDVEVKIDKITKTKTISVSYEVRQRFLANIYIVGDFSDTQVEVRGN